MCALRQKQTYAAQKGMSALPQKADMCGATGDARFWLKADIQSSQSSYSIAGQRKYASRVPAEIRVTRLLSSILKTI